MKLLLAFGVIVTVTSLLGIYGAYVSLDKVGWRCCTCLFLNLAPRRVLALFRSHSRLRAQVDNEQINWWLVGYFLILLLAVILQLVAAGMLLVLVGVVDGARSGSGSAAVTEFENGVRRYISGHQDEWWDIQNYFGCCGYNSATPCGGAAYTIIEPHYFNCSVPVPPEQDDFPLPNPSGPCGTQWPIGDPTVKVSGPPCKRQLLARASTQITALGSMAVLFAFAEVLCMIAACCLLYCVKNTGPAYDGL
jgi:uncharacterized membrane protein